MREETASFLLHIQLLLSFFFFATTHDDRIAPYLNSVECVMAKRAHGAKWKPGRHRLRAKSFSSGLRFPKQNDIPWSVVKRKWTTGITLQLPRGFSQRNSPKGRRRRRREKKFRFLFRHLDARVAIKYILKKEASTIGYRRRQVPLMRRRR